MTGNLPVGYNSFFQIPKFYQVIINKVHIVCSTLINNSQEHCVGTVTHIRT